MRRIQNTLDSVNRQFSEGWILVYDSFIGYSLLGVVGRLFSEGWRSVYDCFI